MSRTRTDVATADAPPRRQRQPLTALGKLTVAALIGLALSYLYLVVVLIGTFEPIAITAPISLLLAGIVATGWRPAPGIAALVCFLGLLPELPMLPGHLQQITTDPPSFIVNVLVILPLFVFAIGVGIAATVQNYRRAS